MAIFDPFDTPPVYAPPARGVARIGDQNAEIGFTSAKLRARGEVRRWFDADGEPTGDAKALMAAPKGR